MTDDFTRGEQAYKNGDDELYFSGSPGFRAGFENAFHADNPQYDNGGNGSEAAFEAYIDGIWRPPYEEAAKRIAAKQLAYQIAFLALGVCIGYGAALGGAVR